MDGEELGDVVAGGGRPGLEDGPGPGVQQAALTERQALIGGVPDEDVGEADHPVRPASQEAFDPAQPLPQGPWRHLEHGREDTLGGLGAQHRGSAQQPAVVRGEGVDGRGDHRLDALRQAGQGAGGGGTDQFGEEQRVATASLH